MNGMTQREVDDVMNIYKDMKANHFQLKDNTGGTAKKQAPGAVDIVGIKKLVDGEKIESKGYNEHSNLPFSHDQTAAIAIPDGLYGKTIYSLK